jgi:hypothetical protein
MVGDVIVRPNYCLQEQVGTGLVCLWAAAQASRADCAGSASWRHWHRDEFIWLKVSLAHCIELSEINLHCFCCQAKFVWMLIACMIMQKTKHRLCTRQSIARAIVSFRQSMHWRPFPGWWYARLEYYTLARIGCGSVLVAAGYWTSSSQNFSLGVGKEPRQPCIAAWRRG